MVRQDAANGPWICLKIADDFAAKSADNGWEFRPGSPGTYQVNSLRGSLMKSFKLIGLALGASFALSASAFAQDITVAVAGPMTGGESAFGRQMKNGAEMAVADLNAGGGLLGKKLALDVEDDACDPKQARSVAEKIGSAKIPFVAGHYCSSSSIPASEAYADGNVLQITPASTNPLFTERKLWNVARVCGRDDQQGLVAAEYIAKNYKGKNVAILNDKTTYGEGPLFTFGPDPRNKATAKAIVERFKAKGVDPEGYTLYTYAAMQVWSQAVAKTGTTDPKKVMDTIKGGAWDTVIGKMEFDAKGDIKQIDYVVYKWDAKGNYTEINPKGS